MENKKRMKGLLLLMGIALLIGGCKEGNKNTALDGQPVVGSVKVVDGDSLWTCDFSALKDTIVLPLSAIAEELQVVKLDDSDEA